MATVTDRGGTWNTNASGQTVVATPAVNDLIVVVHGGSGWAAGDDSTISDNQGGTYGKTGPISTGGGTAGALWVSIADRLVPSATSTTWTNTASGLTGGGLTVFSVSGMVRVGGEAIRQYVGESTQTENPPSIAFAVATLTANPVILAVFGEDNPAAVTPPASFTEADDTGWATPTSGIEVCFVSSGQTSSSYAWSGGALIDHNEIGVELNTDQTIPMLVLVGPPMAAGVGSG